MKKTTPFSLLLSSLLASSPCTADMKSPAISLTDKVPVFAQSTEESQTGAFFPKWPVITKPLDAAASASKRGPNCGVPRERYCRKMKELNYDRCAETAEIDSEAAIEHGLKSFRNAALNMCRTGSKREYTKCMKKR